LGFLELEIPLGRADGGAREAFDLNGEGSFIDRNAVYYRGIWNAIDSPHIRKYKKRLCSK
jgi:hypothetical protein